MNEWLEPLAQRLARGQRCVLVSIVEARGSTPREAGVKMVVTSEHTFATIGGGQLEYRCTELARKLLRQGGGSMVERFTLGSSLGQCCGGATTVMFEHVAPQAGWVADLCTLQKTEQPLVLASIVDTVDATPRGQAKLVITADSVMGGSTDPVLDAGIAAAGRQALQTEEKVELRNFSNAKGDEHAVLLEPIRPPAFNIVLFGAGHVGRALVRVLADLPCRVRWVDHRPGCFPDEVPPNVVCCGDRAAEDEVDAAPPGAYFLVMTHSHALDQAICEWILLRNDFQYCGLIGSGSKRKKFEKRFRAAGISEQVCEALVCPIGAAGISGKHPAEIAIAVAAQLLQRRQQSEQHLAPAGEPRRWAG